MMRPQYLISVLILVAGIAAAAQNALYQATLRIFEEHDLYDNHSTDTVLTPWMPEYSLKADLNDVNLYDLIWQQVSSGEVPLYIWPVGIFEGENVRIRELEEQVELTDHYGMELPGVQDVYSQDRHGIMSVFTIDEWSLDREEFILEKIVAGICPVRWIRKETAGIGYPGKFDRILLGIVKYSARQDNLYKRKRGIKRLVPLASIEYEFIMVNEAWLSALDHDSTGLWMNGPSPYYLENSPQWNKQHGKHLTDAIFNQAFEQGREIFKIDTHVPMDIDSMGTKVFSEKEMGDGWRELWDDGEYSLLQSVLQERIFSLIFYEEWSIDPETLYLVKTVKSVAPVFWKVRENSDTAEDVEANPEYEKIPLFRIDFNSR
ncbi:MAG: hypothetical protein WD052_01490 [Bacteroidales bacterium]